MPTLSSFGGGDGAETIYALRNTDDLAHSILNEIAAEGQNIRKYYQRRLPSNPSEDYYFIHRLTGKLQPVIIEYGFLDSPGDDVAQLKNNLLDYGEAVVRAVTRYLGYPYVPLTEEKYYIVKPGDTLYSLANRFKVTVATLKEANNLTTDLLTVGQQLIIPTEIVMPPITPPTGLTHIVKAGDTLYSLARTYGIIVDQIRQANQLTTDLLTIGQRLIIPTGIVPPETIEPTIYTVQLGDTLYSISRKFSLTVDELKTANQLTSNLLSVGQELVIPTEIVTPTPPLPTEPLVYEVKAGDNLYSLANRFNVTVSALKEANNLTSNLLSIGQQLIIPVTEVGAPVTYTVQSGDSLWTISQRFGVTVDDIKKVNNLTSNLLSINQQLLIPAHRGGSYQIDNRQDASGPLYTPISEPWFIYVVRSGDTITSIAQKFNVPLTRLRTVNNLNDDLLLIGRELIIPIIGLDKQITYTVEPGDTLWSIAKVFNITVKELKQYNNLTSDLIYPDQELFILLPLITGDVTKSITHIVKPGETLWSIAKRYNVTVDELKSLNNLSSNLITINQELLIPQSE